MSNESHFLFSSSTFKNDVVKRLRSLDTTKNVSENLRKSFLEIRFWDFDFGLMKYWLSFPFLSFPKLLPKYPKNIYPITLHRSLIEAIIMTKVTVTIVTLLFQMMMKVMY